VEIDIFGPIEEVLRTGFRFGARCGGEGRVRALLGLGERIQALRRRAFFRPVKAATTRKSLIAFLEDSAELRGQKVILVWMLAGAQESRHARLLTTSSATGSR